MTLAKIYVPKAVNKDIHTKVKKALSEGFGGFTMYFTHGGWVNSNHELVEEKTLVYESYTDIIYSDVRSDMKALAEHVKETTNEDAVLYVINNDSYIA